MAPPQLPLVNAPPIATAPLQPLTPPAARRLVTAVAQAIEQVVVGQDATVLKVLVGLLARGHLLLEDVPGVGKTTLARTVAKAIGARFGRIQFTADLLPSDIVGVQMLGEQGAGLRFRPGPIFAELVLADEINRASPKAQSAMLEAMAERHVSVDEHSYPLPLGFAVIATQNPSEHHGVYPLPESQLDRFLLRLHLGYPDASFEQRLLLAPHEPERALAAMAPVCSLGQWQALCQTAAAVHLSPDVAGYIVALAHASRHHPMVRLGLSPRATLAMAQAARAWAFVQGREYVTADDVQAMAPHVFLHRLALAQGAQGLAILDELLSDVAVVR